MTAIFTTVLGMSLAAGIAAVVVLILRFALRKAPKIYSYVLWSIVFFRLMVPVTLQSPLGIIPSDAGMLPGRILYEQAASPSASGSQATVVLPDDTQPSPTDVVSPASEAQNRDQCTAPSGAQSDSPANFLQIAVSVWLAGCILLLGYSAFCYLRLSRRLGTAVRISADVFESDRISTAFVLGLLHPTIYVPAGLSPAQLDFILRHEHTHIRRRDNLIKLLTFFVLVLHWFNPVVWLSYFLMTKDMEMSCDENVLRSTGDDIRRDYSNALLNLSARRAGLLLPLSFGEDNVRARIRHVLCYKKPAIWSTVLAVVLVVLTMAGCMADRTPPSDPTATTPVSDPSPAASPEEPADNTADDPAPASSTDEPDPLVLKYYNYFLEHHSLTDNDIFTVDENTLQSDVMYFAFMNTQPIDGNAENIRSKKQIDDVLDKYFGIRPKRYSTGSTSLTSDGNVQLGSIYTGISRHNRLLLKKLIDNGDGSFSAVFKLYQIMADSAPADFDARILSGDTEMEGYYTMDVDAVFTEIPEGDSYYLHFSKFSLVPRNSNFSIPPQETDYTRNVSSEELASYHGLSIDMTLDEAKNLLNLPESAYTYSSDSYSDYTTVDVDGWHYTFRARPKEETDDRTQYLWIISIREYQGMLFRDIRLGDAYEDVIKKFPAVSQGTQLTGEPGSYYTQSTGFAGTMRSVDIFTGNVQYSMTFGMYGTLVWADIYDIGD